MKKGNLGSSGNRLTRNKMTQHILLAFGVSFIGGVVTMPAYAQAKGDAIEEIIVTARKTKEKLQEVPLAIAAFTSEALKTSGATNIQEIARLTAGMTVADEGTEGGSNSAPVIRGMTNISSGGDPNVSFFLDGVYLANGMTTSMGLIGLERVEVVKGPVSALYGRNAFAGAINYVSKRPPAKFGGDASVTLGSAGQKTAIASVGGPIGEGMLRANVTVALDKFDGTWKDGVNGLRAGGHDKKDAQISLLLTLSERTEIVANYYYGDDYFNDPAMALITGNCGPKSTNPISLGDFTRYCGELNYKQRPVEVADIGKAGSAGNTRLVNAASLKLSHETDWADITALFGYNDSTAQRFTNFTGTRDGIPFQLYNAAFVALPGQSVTMQELFGFDAINRDKSFEIRLASKQNQPLRWATGLYYFDATSQSSTIIGLDGSRIPAGLNIGKNIGTSSAPSYVTPTGAFSTSNVSRATSTDKLKSEFVALDYDVIKNLTIGGEYRSSQQDKTQDILRSTCCANLDHPIGLTPPARFVFQNARLSANYKFTPDLMFYSFLADGTKAGGFNLRATIPSEVSFQPETVKSFEVGMKSAWLDNRLQVGVAAYKIKSKNVQLNGSSDDPANVGLVIKNFGGITSQGFEIDTIFVPAKGVKLNLGLAYTDPKFDGGTYDYSNAAICLTIPSCAQRVVAIRTPQGTMKNVVDMGGLQTVRSSKVQVSFGAQYNTRLMNEYDWVTRIDYRYESKMFNNDNTQLAFNWIPDKTIVNVRTGLTKGPLTLTGYINNLTNNTVPANAGYLVKLNDFTGRMVATFQPERTYGLTMAYKF